MPYCSNCGQSVFSDANYCSRCGSSQHGHDDDGGTKECPRCEGSGRCKKIDNNPFGYYFGGIMSLGLSYIDALEKEDCQKCDATGRVPA